MKRFLENVLPLCRKNPDLTPEDIRLIREESKKLPIRADRTGRDIFVNIVSSVPNETVTVALAHCDNSAYNLSTLGFSIRDEDEPAVLRTLQYGIPSKNMWAISYTTTDGNRIVQDAFPVKNNGRTIAVIVEERRLKQSEVDEWKNTMWIPSDYQQYPFLKYLDWLGECIDDAVVVINRRGFVIYRNASAKALYHEYGYVFDIYGQEYVTFSMHGPLRVWDDYDHAYRIDEIYSGGHYYHVKQYCLLDQEPFYVVVTSDITKEHEKDEDLVLKTVAVREAHHRIKNNLQTVYDLLDMQRRRSPSAECVQALSDTMSRIMSISTSYEQLLLRSVDEADVLGILDELRKKYLTIIRDGKTNISIEVSGDSINVKASIVTDISMVVSELIQNAYKYAFEGRDAGLISITVEDRPPYGFITVRDNGVGMREAERSKNQSGGLGFSIVKSIVKSKLHGKVQMCSGDKGTTVTLSFKHQNP